MRKWQEIQADLDRQMPDAGLDRRGIEMFREWLGLPEGFDYAEAEARMRALVELAAEGQYWGFGTPLLPWLAALLAGKDE